MNSTNFDWDFFENFNGLVYITDIETNQLVYMNKRLRDSVGFHDSREYKGLLCHEVLQGRKEPCDFCTSNAIRQGKFISWTHRNPVIDRDFLLNDTLVSCNGKDYRLEIAVDLAVSNDAKSRFYSRSEQILNECLRKMFSVMDENLAIDEMLRYIGETFDCDRVYIFETADQKRRVDNTYEWCNHGIAPQKDFLQSVPYESVAFWFDFFEREGILSIANLEDIRESYPLTYAYLHPQGIRSVMVGPIRRDGDFIGFIGADNPKKETLDLLSSLVRVVGYFVSILLRRRDLTAELRKQSYRDTLTGALNRNALTAFFDEEMKAASLGVVYCDVSGLKQVNDLYGHDAGDALILQSYHLINAMMEKGNTYRVGGDEFVSVCLDMTQEDFARHVELLRQKISSERHHIAVGSTWTDSFPVSFDELIKKADMEMYRDKQQYYCNCSSAEKRSRDRRISHGAGSGQQNAFFQQSLPELEANSRRTYTCIGDYQSRCYYISDGMKEKFGFSGNIVYDFLSQWEKRIIGHVQQRMFRSIIEQTMLEKQTYIHFTCPVQDRDGNVVMARCSGLLQWDETYAEPLTLYGGVQIEQRMFHTDPITSFPTMQTAAEKLSGLKASAAVLLFKLNHFGKINGAKGRDVGNRLLKSIAEDLREQLSGAADFYRLEGLKFMAVFNEDDRPHQERMDIIRSIVTRQYKIFDVAMAEAITFMPIEYSNQQERPLELLQNVTALMNAAELSPVSQAITNSNVFLKDLKQEIDMEFALARDIQNDMSNFRAVVQPTVSSKTGEILGGEVLLRWQFQGKDVSPGVFIPLIERSKLMSAAGKWVLEQTVQCCRNITVYRPDMYLTFNVSYQQILSYNFADTIQSTLVKYGIEGRRIVVELTETHVDDAPVRLKEFVDSCETIGVQIALDDFGNGYSSLGLLLKYSAQIIKLDRSILLEMVSSEEKEWLVSSLVESCHKMGKQVCIEGVETEAELAVAQKVGCDMIQGFYYYSPLELCDLYQELSRGCVQEAPPQKS